MSDPPAAVPAQEPGPVLVTGATGFLGRPVVAALLAGGGAVRALVRDPGAVLPPGAEPVLVEGLHDRAALARACRGVRAVVHLAARVHVMRDRAADPLAEFRRVNVEGTRVLMEEALSAGADRFVLASSVKAVGEASEGGCWNEETQPRPVDPYGVSKLEAERVVLGLAGAAGAHAAVLRLPMVYGAGVKGNMLRLFRAVERGLPLPLGGIANRRSLAAAANVVAAVLAVLGAPAAAGRAFYVSDGQDLSTPELVRRIAAALGRRARLLPVPPVLFRAAGRAGDVVASVAPYPLTTPAVKRLLGSLCVDSSPLGRATGWRPAVSVDEGLREVAAWLRAGAPAAGRP